MKLSIDQASDLRDVIIKRKLIAPDWFWCLSNSDLQKAYNGIGNERMYIGFRKILSLIYHFCKASILIHDVIYYFADNKQLTKEDFYEANKNLKINARKCLLHSRLKFIPPYYLWCWIKCFLAQIATNLFGYKYFISKDSKFKNNL